VADGVDIFL